VGFAMLFLPIHTAKIVVNREGSKKFVVESKEYKSRCL
jgi:hypothetical protein